MGKVCEREENTLNFRFQVTYSQQNYEMKRPKKQTVAERMKYKFSSTHTQKLKGEENC